MNKFLEENGPGIYGIIFRVADVKEGTEELQEKGVEPIGTYFHEGFGEVLYHPKDFGGVLTLLVEYDAPHPSRTAWEG